MKFFLTTAAFALVAAPLLGQTSGVSNPPAAIITATPDEVVVQKPSAAIPAAAPTPLKARPVYEQPEQPAQVQPVPSYQVHSALRDPDAEIVTSVHPAEYEDNNAGVVTAVASRPGEVPVGTLLRTRIRETLSTVSTRVGAHFSAEVTAPMECEGRVVIPVGSIVEGRVTQVRGGRRINGTAALHLSPESVTLPDGTHYHVRLQVVDTEQRNVTKLDDEGTILRRDHALGTLAAMSLTTGGAAAAGAMVGGGVGAVVGAGIGAGVSTVWWLKQDRQEVVPQNTGITFDLVEPLHMTPLTLGTN